MPVPEHFKRAEDEFQRLDAQRKAGRLTQSQFEAALESLMVEYEGRYWSIGARTGKWYVYDGQNWIESLLPVQPLSAGTVSRAPATPSSPKRSGLSCLVITIVIVVGLIVLAWPFIWIVTMMINIKK